LKSSINLSSSSETKKDTNPLTTLSKSKSFTFFLQWVYVRKEKRECMYVDERRSTFCPCSFIDSGCSNTMIMLSYADRTELFTLKSNI
jgi:hypothetical protein